MGLLYFKTRGGRKWSPHFYSVSGGRSYAKRRASDLTPTVAVLTRGHFQTEGVSAADLCIEDLRMENARELSFNDEVFDAARITRNAVARF